MDLLLSVSYLAGDILGCANNTGYNHQFSLGSSGNVLHMKAYVKSLLQDFLEDFPKFKRILFLVNAQGQGRCVVWTTYSEEQAIENWKTYFEDPIRVVPNSPLEGGMAQAIYNAAWDEAHSLMPKVRMAQVLEDL